MTKTLKALLMVAIAIAVGVGVVLAAENFTSIVSIRAIPQGDTVARVEVGYDGENDQENDSEKGSLELHGNASTLGAELTFHNAEGEDSNVDVYKIEADGDFVFEADDEAVWRVEEDTKDVRIETGLRLAEVSGNDGWLRGGTDVLSDIFGEDGTDYAVQLESSGFLAAKGDTGLLTLGTFDNYDPQTDEGVDFSGVTLAALNETGEAAGAPGGFFLMRGAKDDESSAALLVLFPQDSEGDPLGLLTLSGGFDSDGQERAEATLAANTAVLSSGGASFTAYGADLAISANQNVGIEANTAVLSASSTLALESSGEVTVEAEAAELRSTAGSSVRLDSEGNIIIRLGSSAG